MWVPHCAQAQQSYEVVAQNGVPMKTRDGVTLRADIYRPKADGKFPVILMRTPYDKSASWAVSPGYQLATHGYVVVVQDVRGRYTSEGEWYPFRHESEDGYDTVEWVAALPYSNGKVGMMGGSYVGATQMLAAIAHPPHLAGICPVVTASNYHDGWTYQGGALEQWFDQNWTTQLATNTLWRLRKTPTRWWARQCFRSLAIRHSITPRFRRPPTPRPSLRRIILIGSRIPAMTRIGSSGPSRSTIRIFRFRPFTSAVGMTFF